jgi:outer membrane biosynthesis protein TonB
MKDQQIYSSFYFSLGLHSFFLIAIIVYILITGSSHKMKSITVSLIQSSTRGTPSSAVPTRTKQIEPAEKAVTKPVEESRTETRPAVTAKDRIAALQAKMKAVRSASQRRHINISKDDTKVAGGGEHIGSERYQDQIGAMIQRNWANADFLNKYRSLSAIIVIRIARSGDVTILGWEKKSGNALFDREALRAITMSTPLPPPPTEMEIGVNFDPQKGR